MDVFRLCMPLSQVYREAKAMIYLDNAATTPLGESVVQAMSPFFGMSYGNPSSLHSAGRTSRLAIDKARRMIADWLGCNPHDLVFTSGGTEADASAMTGAFLANRETRSHIVASAVEHHAVLHTLAFLESLGASVTYVPVDGHGRVRVADVCAALRTDTCAVSIMSVNNEVGTIQPVEEIAQAVKVIDPDILIHSDMVQSLPFMAHPLKVSPTVDLATFSAHKIHGPKGMGVLYVRQGIAWVPTIHGGLQEGRRRGGTENVAAIVGFGAAVDTLQSRFQADVQHLRLLQSSFFHTVQNSVDVIQLGDKDGAPTILNLAFPGVRNDTLLMRLDMEGLAVSAGSACTAGSLEPSHVILAMGLVEYLHEAVRFSFGAQNTMEEVIRAANIVIEVVQDLVLKSRK